MKKQLCIFGIVSLLTACSDANITSIKESRLNQYQEFTIEQAFDHRKVCSEIEWESFTDDRERNVIEYRCHLKGVADFFVSEAEKSLTRNQNSYENLLISIESSRTNKQESLKQSEIDLANAKSKMTDSAKQAYADKKWIELKTREDFLAAISEAEVSSFADKELPPHGSATSTNSITELKNIASDYEDSRKEGEEASTEFYKKIMKNLVDEEEDNFNRAKSDLISKLKRGIDHYRYATEREISNHLKWTASSITQLEKQIASTKSILSEIDLPAKEKKTELEKKQQEFDEFVSSSDSINAHEFYQWVILDNGEFQIISGGLVLNQPGQEPKTTTFRDISAILKIVYQNKITDFETYKKTLTGMAWGRLLGY